MKDHRTPVDHARSRTLTTRTFDYSHPRHTTSIFDVVVTVLAVMSALLMSVLLLCGAIAAVLLLIGVL